MAQVVAPMDETTLDVLQARLYPRLEQALLVAMHRERERVPPYYEQFVGSEIRRVEESIEHLDRRIEETSEQLNRRIEETSEQLNRRIEETNRRIEETNHHIEELRLSIDQRFARLETCLDEMNVRFRNWALAAVAFLGILTTVLSIVLR